MDTVGAGVGLCRAFSPTMELFRGAGQDRGPEYIELESPYARGCKQRLRPGMEGALCPNQGNRSYFAWVFQVNRLRS